MSHPPPENIVLLSSQPPSQPSQAVATEQLRKQLLENQRRIRRLEDSIVKKRDRLTELSNSINRVLEKQLAVKFRQPSFLDMMKAAEQQPNLKLKLDEIGKLEKAAEQAKQELEQLHTQRDSSVGHQASTLVNTASQKQAEVDRLKREKETWKNHNLLSSLTGEDAQDPHSKEVSSMVETLHALRKDLKELEKRDRTYDKQQNMLCAFSCEMEEKMDSYVIWKQLQEKIIDRKQLSDQAVLLEAALKEREQMEKESSEEITSKTKQIREGELRGNELKKKLRDLQNFITRGELESVSHTKRASTERNSSTQNLKDTVQTVQHTRKGSLPVDEKKKTQPTTEKLTHKLGSLTQTPTSIIVSDSDITHDPLVRMTSMKVYTTKTGQLLGIEATYTRSGEILRGKKMTSHSLYNSDEHVVDLEQADSLSIVYDDTLIYALKRISPNGTQLVGVGNPGIVRQVNLRQYNIVGLEARIDFETTLESARLVGLTLITERKVILRKHMTHPNPAGFIEQDIQISHDPDEPPKRGKSMSQRNIINGGSLPKINVKQIIDHRLMGFHPSRRS